MLGPYGVKRKFGEVEEEEEENNYLEERQSILDISMFKLRMAPVRRTEPSLRRSVLIYNTLRVIEHELRQEGVTLSPVSSNLFPSLQESDVNGMTLDPIPGAELANFRPECPMSMDTSSSADSVSNIMCPPLAPPTPAPRPCSTLAEPEAEPEPMLHTLQPVSSTNKLLSTTTDVLLNNDRLSLSGQSTMFELDSGHSGPFGDVDWNLYDYDLFSPFSSNMKMAPLSAEELMHSFPAEGHPALSSPSPCYRNELLNDDLDHIMQVLVGI